MVDNQAPGGQGCDLTRCGRGVRSRPGGLSLGDNLPGRLTISE